LEGLIDSKGQRAHDKSENKQKTPFRICKVVIARSLEKPSIQPIPSPIALLKSFVLLLVLVLVPMAVFSLCCTVTWQGRLLSASVGMIGLGPLLWCIEKKLPGMNGT
jgi:hypothetical protein